MHIYFQGALDFVPFMSSCAFSLCASCALFLLSLPRPRPVISLPRSGTFYMPHFQFMHYDLFDSHKHPTPLSRSSVAFLVASNRELKRTKIAIKKGYSCAVHVFLFCYLSLRNSLPSPKRCAYVSSNFATPGLFSLSSTMPSFFPLAAHALSSYLIFIYNQPYSTSAPTKVQIKRITLK